MADALLFLAVLVIVVLLAALRREHRKTRELRELRRIIAASRGQRKRRFLPLQAPKVSRAA